jgi:hypothetical protein
MLCFGLAPEVGLRVLCLVVIALQEPHPTIVLAAFRPQALNITQYASNFSICESFIGHLSVYRGPVNNIQALDQDKGPVQR